MVFREVRRVLRDDGTLWLNLGDSYATGAGNVGEHPGGGAQGAKWRGNNNDRLANSRGDQPAVLRKKGRADRDSSYAGKHTGITAMGPMTQPNRMPQEGLKPKDLCEIPSDVVRALRADGWWLRSRIPWLKRNAMPESTKDRPTTAVEYVFLLSKSERYYYDGEAVKKPSSPGTHERLSQANIDKQVGSTRAHAGGKTNGNMKAVGDRPRKLAETGSGTKNNSSFDDAMAVMPISRARRNSDWFFESWQGMLQDEGGDPLALIVNPQPFKEAHFATFPPTLIEPAIASGSSEHGCCVDCGAPWSRLDNEWPWPRRYRVDGLWKPGCDCYEKPIPCTVLDPFGGSGTTGMVSDRLQRDAVLIELNPEYATMAENRIHADGPLFSDVTA